MHSSRKKLAPFGKDAGIKLRKIDMRNGAVTTPPAPGRFRMYI